MNLRLYPLFFTLIGFLLASTNGFCDEDLDTRIGLLESDMTKVRTKTAFETYGARMASASPQIDGSGFFITADFLWWKLYEGGTEYVNDITNLFQPGALNGSIKHLNFEWEPGYKVGMGYLFDENGWDLYFNLTSLSTHAHHSISTHVQELVPLIGESIQTFFKARANWHIDFYDLEGVLGRNYFVSKYLCLHPYFGLTSAWIKQHRHAQFKTPSDVLKLHSKNHFWGIGPRLGMDTQFFLGRNFSLYGDITGALLWGHFHVTEKEDALPNDVAVYDLHYSLHRMVATIGFGLGIAFEANFNHDRNHFRIKTGYEGQYWWRQNQLPIFFNPFTLDFNRQSEDLSMQGLTVDFRIDF